MREFLILKLHGPMQAWGEHSFEGLRPSGNFPTRSGLLGLLAACLGIRRNDRLRMQQLANSVGLAVRVDEGKSKTVKITDYHTVKDARKEYAGLGSHETIQTWREYLLDAYFTVALWNHVDAAISIEELEEAVKFPRFTPYLGRRCCPISRPLFEACLSADNSLDALNRIEPLGGTIYSEEGDESVRRFRIRDVPLANQPRQFSARNIYVYGGSHVSE